MGEHTHHLVMEKDENRALLAYMVHHNEHHAAELEELAEKLGGPAGGLILQGVADLKTGNKKLEEALALLPEEDV